MRSKSPLSSTTIRVTVPSYYLPVMLAQSKRLPGCKRPDKGSESHFAKVAIDRFFKDLNVNMEMVKQYEINMLNKGISSNV